MVTLIGPFVKSVAAHLQKSKSWIISDSLSSRASLVCIMTRLRAEFPSNRGSVPGRGERLHLSSLKAVHTGSEAQPAQTGDHWPASSAEADNGWRYTFTPTSVLMTCIGRTSVKSLAAVVARMNRAGVANTCQSKQNVLQLSQFSSGMVSVTVTPSARRARGQ